MVCVFDAFGTLFDLDIPLAELDNLTDGQGQQVLDIWRRKQLEYTWLRGLMDAYVPFDQVTRDALTYTMKTLNIHDNDLYQLLMPIYLQPRAFADVLPSLQTLRAAGHQTAILSNGTPKMLKEGAAKAGVIDNLDHLLSVEVVQTFKPAAAVYQMVLKTFNCSKQEVRFFSSNAWDIAGAGQFGLPTVWVNRKGGVPEELPQPPTYQINSLAACGAVL